MAKTPTLDLLERVEVTSRMQWRAWLQANHNRSDGTRLVTWKKATPEKRLSYVVLVMEALCFGLIGHLPRKLDEVIPFGHRKQS